MSECRGHILENDGPGHSCLDMPPQKEPVAWSGEVDDEFQPINEISESIRNMISAWEKARASTHAEDGLVSSKLRILPASPMVCESDQPPQRYRRASKRVQVG